MPFITSEARRMTDSIGPKEVGDRCFIYYREMLRAFRASPRWTTIHGIYCDMLNRTRGTIALDRNIDDIASQELAWQVFFQLHAMPYEMQKRTLNGEIDY